MGSDDTPFERVITVDGRQALISGTGVIPPMDVIIDFVRGMWREPEQPAKSELPFEKCTTTKEMVAEWKKDDSDNGGKCTICLDAMEVGSEVPVVKCKHVFHEECLDNWRKFNEICPCCRYHVPLAGNEDSDEQHDAESSQSGTLPHPTRASRA